VNLQGAFGVLVNITAGMNLTMKEFEEIGNAVSDLASDDATVVIGTVIDPEIGDELRVTVVATGLGDSQKKRKPEDEIEAPMQIVRNGTTGMVEPHQMGDDGHDSVTTQTAESETSDMFTQDSNIDYLDIPAFLRNQAD
jgi:cell division protein FtsZ